MILSVVAAVVTLSIAQVTVLHATNTAQVKRVRSAKTPKKECTETFKAIKFYKQAAWKWEDYFGVRHTKSSTGKINRTACKYAQWVAQKWVKRTHELRSWNRTLENTNRSFDMAAKLATFVFPNITFDRLWHRADVEGGHGEWICNSQGSGACGWFQFKEGTFYGRATEAFTVARSRGFPIPEKFKSWYSVIGQNLTAAYMFDIGLECAGEGWAASC